MLWCPAPIGGFQPVIGQAGREAGAALNGKTGPGADCQVVGGL